MLALSFQPFPTLSTARLTLRQISPADENDLFFLRSDERVLQYLDRPKAQSIAEISTLIEALEAGRHQNDSIIWAITLTADLKMIGTICYWRIEKEHYRAEIGYVLHPGFQGQGIMQEALQKVLAYGFETMGLHSVEANVNPANTASIKLLEKNQFIREGYFRENYYYNGVFLDSAIYSRLKT